MRRQLRNPNFYLMIFGDAILIVLAHVSAYLFRFEFALDQLQIQQIRNVLIWLVPLKLIAFLMFGLYRGMWRYASVKDSWRLAQACFFSMLLGMAAVLYLYRFEGFSRAAFLIDGLMTFLLLGGSRMAIRTYFLIQTRKKAGSLTWIGNRNQKRLLIIGAGSAGEKMLREIFDNEQLHYQVAGFLDDDPRKQGRTVHGVPVLGPVEELTEIQQREKIQEILIAIPSATGNQMRRIVDVCKTCGVPYKTLPGIGEIIDGRVSIKALRDVNYQDLLGRPPVHLDIKGIQDYLKDRTVLITGPGGSIGSELCRQVIRFQPRSILLLDKSEADLFHIQMELHHELNFRNYQPILGRVQDRPLMKGVFQRYRPHVVFHAAAYKHVPLLEINPWEAAFNNILGSKVSMEIAREHGAERFVLVSTDKAVRPTSVMGVSKRVTELLLQSLEGDGTRLMAVRFGNVVGSSGSVVPLFRRQIEQGGPVTVTHPEVTRYFMTIPEATQLIIQAGAMGEGGEIFILEMGTPVRIADMARDLIRLSGKKPDEDIQIIFTGLREGEKLFEELITGGEDIVPTVHEKIKVLRAKKNSTEFKQLLEHKLEQLYAAAISHDSQLTKRILQEIVPEYTPQEAKTVL